MPAPPSNDAIEPTGVWFRDLGARRSGRGDPWRTQKGFEAAMFSWTCLAMPSFAWKGRGVRSERSRSLRVPSCASAISITRGYGLLTTHPRRTAVPIGASEKERRRNWRRQCRARACGPTKGGGSPWGRLCMGLALARETRSWQRPRQLYVGAYMYIDERPKQIMIV